MPAVPQKIISDVTELIFTSIGQTSQELQVASNLGKNDQTQLQDIEKDINAMEEILTGVQTNLITRIIQRKKQRNSLICFNQLPLEIASNILWLSIIDPWPRRYSYSFLKRQRTISRVCSSWRTLVEDSPRFWSILELSECPPADISKFLEKSQSSGLEIKTFAYSEYDYSPLELSEKWKCLVPHADRIRSLILSFPSPDGLGIVLERPAPILEELRLDSARSYNVQGFDLFCGQASRLKDVALHNIAVKWDSGVLVGLRSLSIVEDLEYLPTEEQVQRLLELNPGLEKLDIRAMTINERFGNDAFQSTRGGRGSRVVMSEMQELRLSKLPFGLVQAILGNVEIPSIRYLELKCLFRGLSASRMLGTTAKHLVPTLLRLSKGTQQVELTFGESSASLAIYTPHHHESPTVQIELKETMSISGFDWLAENFFHMEGLPSVCAADVFQVSLKFGDRFDMAGGTFIPILDRLNAVKVKALTIESWCQHGKELIKYIGKVKGDSQWPLPYLKSIKIGGPDELADHLLTALQCRMQYTPAGGMSAAPRPVMLEVLDIGDLRRIPENVEDALAKCVPSGGRFIPGSWRLERDIFGGSDSDLDEEEI